MIFSEYIITTINVLVHISKFHVKLLANAVTKGDISPVLVKEFPIYTRFIAEVDEHLVLKAYEGSICLQLTFKRHQRPEEIPEAIGIYIALILQAVIFNHRFRNKALLEPESVSKGGIGQGMTDNELFP